MNTDAQLALTRTALDMHVEALRELRAELDRCEAELAWLRTVRQENLEQQDALRRLIDQRIQRQRAQPVEVC